MIVFIFSPSAGAVKPRRHSRILRADITAPEIDPALRAFGRHIARSHRKGRGVHIPAMKKFRPRAGTPHAGTETRI
ncbi:YdaB [Klebsiella pneumoniae IS43]|uniref:YdaB n=1 Tax=Klebsiella pneumoniae IS43 TaxID=1432552 RepID=W1DW62_KLEPN|nr:YdaB [Klebsiella pneumoniae IS43]